MSGVVTGTDGFPIEGVTDHAGNPVPFTHVRADRTDELDGPDGHSRWPKTFDRARG